MLGGGSAAAASCRSAAGARRSHGAALSLPLLLLLAAALRVAEAFSAPFTASRGYSVGKVAPLREWPPLNASSSADLDAIVAARAFGGELVFFQFESQRARWLHFAVNMAAQLSAVGYHHYVALAAFATDCARLHARWRALFPGEPATHPLPACAVAELPAHGSSEQLDHHGFWAGRYAFITALVERRVNAMLLDSDITFHHDMYADLDEPCLANGTLLFLAEPGGPNAGFVYARGAHPDGAAHWVLAQIERRFTLFAAQRAATGASPGVTWEQDILKDAVRVASSASGSHWDMSANGDQAHPFWEEHPQGNYSRVNVSTTMVPLNASDLACPAASRFNDKGTGELSRKFKLHGRPESMQRLYKPADAPGLPDAELPAEHLLYVPGYFMQYGSVVNAGWNAANMPSTVTHLLRAGGIWLPTIDMVDAIYSHVSRIANMQAFGFWLPALFEEEAASKPLMFLKDSLVTAASRRPDVGPLRELLARALRAAALTQRLLVLPPLPCDSPWLRRSENGNGHGGVADNRVVVVPRARGGVDCYVGAHSYEFCWPWDHVAYAYDPIVARRRAAAIAAPWRRDELLPSRVAGDVVVTHLPVRAVAEAVTPQDAAMMEHLEADCKDIFAKMPS